MAVRYWGAKYYGESGDTKPTAGSNTSGLEDGWLFVESDTDKLFVYDSSDTTWADIVGIKIGSTIQAYDAGLQSISGLSTAANKMIYTTASDTYATTDLTAAARTILDDASVGAIRTTLGVGTGDSPTFTAITTTGALTVNGNATLGDAATDTLTINAVLLGASPLVFEGATANAFETTLAIADPTADRTWTLPDATDTFVGKQQLIL